MTKRPTLPEPVPVDSFWRNRRHEAVVSTLSTFEGRNIFDVRIHEMQQGKLVPTRKGVAVVVLRLPDLHKAITKALKRAVELGLLDGAAEPATKSPTNITDAPPAAPAAGPARARP